VKHSNPTPWFSWPRASKRSSSRNVRQMRSPMFVLFAALLVVAALDAGQAASKPRLPAAHRAWLEEEAVYIITATERSVFLKLQSDRERDIFIEAFWRQRDPTPGTPENEFKTEHFRSSDTGPTGWRRGRVG